MINFIKNYWNEGLLKYTKNKKFTFYFVLCLIFIWGSGQLVGEIFSMINPTLDKELEGQLRAQNVAVSLILGLIVAPILETAILVYSLHLSKQTSYKKYYILIATLPICILHLPEYWELSFIVFFPFYFQAIAYISVREKCSFRNSFLFLIAIHFSCNFISIISNMYYLGQIFP